MPNRNQAASAPKTDTLKAVVDALLANPLGAITLGSIIVGGITVFYALTNDVAAVRHEMSTAIVRSQAVNGKQNDEISELRTRISRAEGAFVDLQKTINDMRSDVREITTNMRWLIKDREKAEDRRTGNSPGTAP